MWALFLDIKMTLIQLLENVLAKRKEYFITYSFKKNYTSYLAVVGNSYYAKHYEDNG